MSKPTHADAELILKLYDLRREPRLRQARQWFVGKFSASSLTEVNAQCPPGSEEATFFRMVTSYWDMAALFVVEGVLHEGLFIRSAGEALLVWEKLRPFIAEQREAFRNPNYLKNLETVAERHAALMKETAPGAYESLIERVIRR